MITSCIAARALRQLCIAAAAVHTFVYCGTLEYCSASCIAAAAVHELVYCGTLVYYGASCTAAAPQ